MTHELLTASDAARLLNISITRLRQLLERGTITPVARTPLGWRLYTRDDLERCAREREQRRLRRVKGSR